MLPDFNKRNLIDFIDVFCEEGYFNIQQSSWNKLKNINP